MSWYSVRASPGATERDEVLRILFELGSQGVEESGEVLVTWFPDTLAVVEVEGALRRAGIDLPLEIQHMEPPDWRVAWRESFQPRICGRFHLVPSWLSEQMTDQGDDLVRLVLEPGMAFGTGEHASTRCALLLVQRYLREGDSVADIGAGSGVLSIAAALLGAQRVFAIENDADAIGNALQNVALNGVGETVLVLEGNADALLPVVAPVKMVVGNIVSGVLLALLPVIRESLQQGGVAVFSGILSDEGARFSEALMSSGFEVSSRECEGDWCAFAATLL